MNNSLIIVESPTKIKTIKKYLGKDYSVTATLGHIKDLPTKTLGVNVKNNFEPCYIIISNKKNVVSNLKTTSKNITNIYLAPDPDREGEAIAWHVAEILNGKNKKFHRILFNELTEKAVINAILNPKNLNSNKYKAQQARRILDRLVGYEISSLLWKKVKRGISAGRVQSVSVRMICEREKRIRAYKSKKYWSISTKLQTENLEKVDANLLYHKNKKIIISNKRKAYEIQKELISNKLIVDAITEKIRKISPQPPFTTSKLQQESIKKLNFSAKKTMLIAQQLYEGIDIGPNEAIGLITYMRTDSIRISKEAAKEAMNFIELKFGSDFVLSKPRIFKNKKKVQDGHEAIRPTSILNTPEIIKPYLSKEQNNLYTMIWQRFLASQMKKAISCHNSINLKAGEYTLSIGVSYTKFNGFKIIYEEIQKNIFKKNIFQYINVGDSLKIKKIEFKQHVSQPPPRFSEASLVKELEENGIGRPSTYTNILSNIRNKGYVDVFKKSYKPTELGFIVNDLLIEIFPEFINVEFTAKMEAKLDKVEQAQTNYVEVLTNFYTKFNKKLGIAKKSMLSIKGVGLATNLECPKCKKNQLRLKIGKNGQFIACSRYPDCTFSSNYERDKRGNINISKVLEDENTDKICEICGKKMLIKYSRYGKFLACSGFPECKNTISAIIPSRTQTSCPKNSCAGMILEKTSKRGKIFYGCEKYPNCDFASWYKPINKICPKCNSKYLIEKTTKNKKILLCCPVIGCEYTKKI